jgi:hypothetical protein
MNIVLLASPGSRFAAMAGKTFTIMKARMTSLFTDLIGFNSTVPAGRFALDRLAGSYVTNWKQPIFPSNVQKPREFNLGRAMTVKIMILGM